MANPFATFPRLREDERAVAVPIPKFETVAPPGYWTIPVDQQSKAGRKKIGPGGWRMLTFQEARQMLANDQLRRNSMATSIVDASWELPRYYWDTPAHPSRTQLARQMVANDQVRANSTNLAAPGEDPGEDPFELASDRDEETDDDKSGSDEQLVLGDMLAQYEQVQKGHNPCAAQLAVADPGTARWESVRPCSCQKVVVNCYYLRLF